LKEIVDFFSNKNILFKSLKNIDKTLLKTRKKLCVYCGTDVKKNYRSIFKIDQKSRYSIKNAEELIKLENKLQQLENHNFKYKHLIINKNICSKTHSYLIQRGWKLHHDFM